MFGNKTQIPNNRVILQTQELTITNASCLPLPTSYPGARVRVQLVLKHSSDLSLALLSYSFLQPQFKIQSLQHRLISVAAKKL